MEQIKDIGNLKNVRYIKIVIPDEKIEFSGKLLSYDRNTIEILTPDGVIGVPNKDIDIYKLMRKPSGLSKVVKKVVKKQPIKTRKELIYDIIKNNPRKKLSGLLKIAEEEIGGDKTVLSNQIKLEIIRIRG